MTWVTKSMTEKRGSKRFKWSRKDLEKLGLRGCLALPWFDDEFWLSSELPDSQLSTAESWDLLFLKINVSRIGTPKDLRLTKSLLTGSGISGNECAHDPMLLQLSSRRRAPLKGWYIIISKIMLRPVERGWFELDGFISSFSIFSLSTSLDRMSYHKKF